MSIYWDLDRYSKLATQVLSLTFLHVKHRRTNQPMFSSCKMNDRKQRKKERRASLLHHHHILAVCMTLIPTDAPDVPPGQKRTRNTCPSTVSQCEISGHKQLLMINQLGSVSVCISHDLLHVPFPSDLHSCESFQKR